MKNDKLIKIAEDSSIELIFLFGSQKENGYKILRGEDIKITDPLTDLDVGVVFKKGFFPRKPYEIFGPVYFELAEVFHPLKPDLIFLEKTDSTFQFEAIKGICIFYSDMERLEDYIEKVLTYAADWKVFRDRIDHDFLSMKG